MKFSTGQCLGFIGTHRLPVSASQAKVCSGPLSFSLPLTSTPITMVAVGSGRVAGVLKHPVHRYGWVTKKLNATKIRKPIRVRVKAKKKQDRTPAEIELSEARKATKLAIGTETEKALDVVSQEAERLHGLFPQHDTRYFLQLLLQRGNK